MKLEDIGIQLDEMKEAYATLLLQYDELRQELEQLTTRVTALEEKTTNVTTEKPLNT